MDHTPTNAEVADVFEQIANILEGQGENPFKIRAYRNAVRTLEHLTEPAADINARGGLKNIPGFGEAIVGKTQEILANRDMRPLRAAEGRGSGQERPARYRAGGGRRRACRVCCRRRRSGNRVAVVAPFLREFYEQDTAAAAQKLLGQIVLRRLPTGETLSGIIVETEAYLTDDPRLPRLPGPDTPQQRDVRAARPCLCLLHLWPPHDAQPRLRAPKAPPRQS